jgi:hypothetical protein
MDRFVQALVTVVDANQRFLLKRAVLQLVLLGIAGAGLWQLSGAWWWLSLVLFVLFLLAAVLGALHLKEHLVMRLEPPWRAVGLGPPVSSGRERVLELHQPGGEVRWVGVRIDLVEGVLTAAREAGLEVITDAEALKRLNDESAHLRRLRDIELLLPHVPSPALRAELSAALPGMSDEVLKEVEILLLAEQDAQTRTSLRGPKPVFEKELRAKLGER